MFWYDHAIKNDLGDCVLLHPQPIGGSVVDDTSAKDERDAPTVPPHLPEVGGTSSAGARPVPAPPPNRTRDASEVHRFGDYELLEEIARGGMGVVYKAQQTSLQRVVALKMILEGHLASEEDVLRFRVEAEAAARLDHPSIVPIYEIGEHDGRHYYSMAYVEGDSLADLLAEGPLPPLESAEAINGAAEAIHHAHRHSVVHRDLKPANILIDERGNPRIIDFGLARVLSRDANLTGVGQVMGTPNYMAPEQAAGKTDQMGPASDIYSLGAILYALLTGRPPFNAATSLDTMLQVIERVPVSPRLLNPAVPIDLETIVMKCLEKDPDRRYRSGQDLANDLDRFRAGKPIKAKPPSMGLRLCRWSRDHLLVTSVSTVIAVALMVVALLAAYRYRHELLRNIELTRELAELENTVEKERTAVQQEKELRLEAVRRGQRNKALRLAAEARLAVSESPELSILLAIEAVDSAGPLSARTEGTVRAALEAALAEHEARQFASELSDTLRRNSWAGLETRALVALARRRVGRSLREDERERYSLNEPY
jgi:predicted Ser/Thr protein kinase